APSTAAVSNDSEKPRPPVPAGKRPKVPKRAERRFLHHIFRVVLVTNEPACQSTPGVEVREHRFFKRRSERRGHRSTPEFAIRAVLRDLPEGLARSLGIRNGIRCHASECSKTWRRG